MLRVTLAPGVINVDGNPSYPNVVAQLKQEGKLGRRCRCRTCPCLNNIVEQDLDISLRTVRRDWNLAKAWFARELNHPGSV